MLTGLDQPEGHRFRELGMEPVETVRIPAPANVLTTVGLNTLTLRLITAAQVWDATHVGLAVGDSATAEAVGTPTSPAPASTTRCSPAAPRRRPTAC